MSSQRDDLVSFPDTMSSASPPPSNCSSPSAIGLVVVLDNLDIDKHQVHIRKDERLWLHSKTSLDWWLVSRQPPPFDKTSSTTNDHLGEPFYVPSNYLVELYDNCAGTRKDEAYEKTSDEAIGSSQDEIDDNSDQDESGDYTNLENTTTTAANTSHHQQQHFLVPQRMAPRRPGVKEDDDESKVEGIYAEPGPVAPRARNRGDRLPPLYANIDLLGPSTTPSTAAAAATNDPTTKEAQVDQSTTQSFRVLGSYKLRRTLWDDWLEYEDTESRRPPLFVNQRTQEKRLKPPRRLTIGSISDETEAGQESEARTTSAATQTTLSYSTPLERRKIGVTTSLTSDDSDDEGAADKEIKNVKDIVRKWNESSMRTRRMTPNASHPPVGKRGSIPNTTGRAGRANLIRGINRLTSRSSEDLLESSSGNNNISSNEHRSLIGKPPLASAMVSSGQQSPRSPLTSIYELLENCPPSSWQKRYDATTQEIYFVNPNNANWFCKQDENGKIYFYNGSPETMSEAPNESDPSKTNIRALGQCSAYNRSVKAHSLATVVTPPPPTTSPPRIMRGENHEIIFKEQFKHSSPFQQIDHVFPPPPSKLEAKDMIFDGHLNRTRTVINGVLQKRKNWTNSYVVLTQYYLLFYKDRKQAGKESPKGSADFVLGLFESKVEWCPPSKSSRKNCFQVSTFNDQVLLQDDQADQSIKWFNTITTCITNLPSLGMKIPTSETISVERPGSSNNNSCANPADLGGSIKLKRSRSTKQYRPVLEDHRHASGCATLAGYATTSSSICSVATGTQHPIDRKVKISERLINFFKKRPSMEALREKGIIRDEAVFGSTLDRLSQRDRTKIPKFVSTCIEAIEAKDLRADGIYRACGNISTVQKLRYEANQERYGGIWKEDDVHVLTGLLKMFFRDMKEPLFPSECMPRLIEVIAMKAQKDKLREMKKLIHELAEPNYETLKFLLQHLLRVISYSSENRMHIQNLAIVFGPTLMRSANDLNNLALEMMMQMQQSQVVDFLLQNFDHVFDK